MRRLAPIVLCCLGLLAPGASAAGWRPVAPGAPVHAAHDHGAKHFSPVRSVRDARGALRKAERLLDGRGARTGYELTPVLKELAVGYRLLDSAERRRAREILERPTIDEGQAGEDEYAVPEHSPPFCTQHFCIHWVDITEDAPPLTDDNANGVPNYIEVMAREFENVYEVENVQLGWRPPPSDGTRGGDVGKTDVYVKQLGPMGIFGYAAPDPGQRGRSQSAYLVMDNDYRQVEYSRHPDFLVPLQVTAAHEYNHVIHYGYDVLQDIWMFESTGVWAEDRVYDAADDYFQYLPAFAQLASVPLTYFNTQDGSDPLNFKAYGAAVWNTWIDEHYGQEAVRGAWERSLDTRPMSFAPAAYDLSLAAAGGTGFFETFTRFAAELAEWRAADSGFSEGPTWPRDMERASPSTLRPDRFGLAGTLDHTGIAFLNVAPTQHPRIRLVARAPRGTASAIALVGLVGSPVGGDATVELVRLRRGGSGIVNLDTPSRFSRITAVLINADVTQEGFSDQVGDWIFTKDRQEVSAHVSTDFESPALTRRTPRPNERRVSRTARIEVRLSDDVTGVGSRSMRLIGPNGRSVRARVTYDETRRRAILRPRARLRARTRYAVRLSTEIVDGGGNALPASARSWRFSTGSR
jgi:hypothetical protein